MPLETLATLPLWAALAVTLLGGAIGGVVYELYNKVDEAIVAFDTRKGAMRAVPLPPTARSIPGAAAVDQTLVDRVEGLLNEAKGIGGPKIS